ncbi:endolytic transglycosylase MltG [Elizabethkingia sp. JS20170427COW]|uniref:endolytic transglycosylase MltG n=1 Tax=Elizabethkingia sp. JS20170427COW TaxID=2583851 RepID=UPI00111098F6|nr:endolytic transglycosylase MltG [Elizabethkingia sp. JS20170427COW]QCX53722.1 endolytic transglycosylase MltG [Elizabethkingia sp. JS20170427COW]
MKKVVIIIVLALLAVGGFLGWRLYKKSFESNVQKEGYVLIPSHSNLAQVMDSLSPYLKNPEDFKKAAIAKGLEGKIKAGRYHIQMGASNRTLVNKLKAGLQTEDTFRIKDFDDVYQMIGRVSKKTEADSLEFVKAFNLIARKKNLNNAEDLKPFFFADTYNFYWTVSPENFFEKFEKDYNQFWTHENITKEKKLGLSRVQVYALASIVQKESGGKKDEQERIAGLYLNRYKKGMKLQSDPTVIYAVNKELNFTKTINRVYFKDLQIDSPYNTYRNIGIPPGPICIVNKTSVESVLNAEKNDFIYMVADTKRPGYHLFTSDAKEHMKNAEIYRDWLNKQQIK